MVEKKRSATGEGHPAHKLTRGQVDQIRNDYRYGLGVKMGRQYGVAESTIYRVAKNKLWIERRGGEK